MKLRKLMFGALACLAFAACSDDNDVVSNVNADGKNPDQMVKINIVTPAVTRALPDQYQIGTSTENNVNDAIFVFFNNNQFVQAVEAAKIDWTNETSENPQVEKISQAVVILNEPALLPTSVIAVLNSPFTSAVLNKKQPNLDAFKQYVADLGSVSKNSKGHFVMSNSVWEGNCETPITTDNLVEKTENIGDLDAGISEKDMEKLIGAQTVEIYVERVLAKVNVKLPDSQDKIESTEIQYTQMVVDSENGGYMSANGAETILHPVIKGLHLSYTSPASYLLKNISDVSGWKGGENFSWNDAANRRSYWGNGITVTAWTDATKADVTSVTHQWGYKQYSNVTTAKVGSASYSFYCQENTVDCDKTSDYSTAASTKLVITAQLCTKSTKTITDAEGNVTGSQDIYTPIQDLVRYKGSYYTEEDFLKLAAQKLIDNGCKFKLTAEGEESNDWFQYLMSTRTADEEAWEIRVVTKSAVEKFAQISVGENVYPSEGVTVENGAARIDEILFTALGQSWEWQNGRCYYFVNIDHLNKEHAVIRNHVYQLNINGIAGMGTPVYDPDKGTDDKGNPDEDGNPDSDTDKDNDDDKDDDGDNDDPEGGSEDDDPDTDEDEEPIIPEKPTMDAFFVSAQLNILKWAIVPQQDVDINW